MSVCIYQRAKKNYLFSAMWFFYIISSILPHTAYYDCQALQFFLKLIRYMVYAFSIYLLFKFGKYQFTTFAGFVLFIIASCMTYIGSRDQQFILYALPIIAAANVSGKHAIRASAIVQGIILSFFIIASQIGFVTDYLFQRGTGVIRHGLGFAWTTTAPIMYLFYCLSYIYLRKEHYCFKEAVFLELINIWLFLKTNTRMAFVLSTCFILFFAVVKMGRLKRAEFKRIDWFYILSPFIICALVLIVQSCYESGSTVWESVDRLLSHRLSLGDKALAEYGISLFGNEIEWVGFSMTMPVIPENLVYNYVDCSYLQILLQYGVIYLLAVLFLYSFIIYKAVYINDYFLVYIILIILIFSVTEPRLVNLVFNPFIVLAFASLDRKDNQLIKTLKRRLRFSNHSFLK